MQSYTDKAIKTMIYYVCAFLCIKQCLIFINTIKHTLIATLNVNIIQYNELYQLHIL